MTRVNVVPVGELSDQWLIAEYRELPRVIKQDISIEGAPERYKLGVGHVKWAKAHSYWVMMRYVDIEKEMLYRGFKVNYSAENLWLMYYHPLDEETDNDYDVTDDDIQINRQRLIEKYKLKPNYYKWTNRTKPEWLN